MVADKSRDSQQRSRAGFTLVDRPGRPTLIAIFRAAALMALADGKAERSERIGLLRFLRSRDLLQHIGRQAAVTGYEAEIGRGETASEALDALGQQPNPRAASLALTAAAYVAAADGRTDATELHLFQCLRERLGWANDKEQPTFDQRRPV